MEYDHGHGWSTDASAHPGWNRPKIEASSWAVIWAQVSFLDGGSTLLLSYWTFAEVKPGEGKEHKWETVPGADGETYEWPIYNKRIYAPDGTYRPAFVTHMRANIKYSPEKMWYALLVINQELKRAIAVP